MSSPVSSTKTSSRFAGPPLAGRCAAIRVVEAEHRDRRPRATGREPLRRHLGGRLLQARGRAVDLDRLAPGVLRDELGRRADRDRLAVRHDRDAVAQARGLLDVVRRHQDRDALGAQPVDQRPQLLAHLRIEADRRLVEQHEPGLVDQRAADQQPAAHAAGQLVDLRVAALREVRDREHALDRRLALEPSRRGRGARTRSGSARPSASCRGCRAAGRRPSRRGPASSAPGSG